MQLHREVAVQACPEVADADAPRGCRATKLVIKRYEHVGGVDIDETYVLVGKLPTPILAKLPNTTGWSRLWISLWDLPMD